jgi:hypothetical protein
LFCLGVGLGIVALLATLGAEWTAERFNPSGRLASATAFLAAFTIYEGLLFLTSIIVQSGVEDYTAAIVGRIFAINAIAFIGLLVVNRIGVSLASPSSQGVSLSRPEDAVDVEAPSRSARGRDESFRICARPGACGSQPLIPSHVDDHPYKSAMGLQSARKIGAIASFSTASLNFVQARPSSAKYIW